MRTLNKLFSLLSQKERAQAIFLLLLIILVATFDAIGIASILPLIAVLTNPIIIETNLVLYNLYERLKIFGVENEHQFLLVLCFIVFFLLITSQILRAFTAYFQAKFILLREYTLGKKLMEGYFNHPYIWFLSQHSADLGKTILSEVGEVIHNGLRQFIELIAKSIVAISMIAILLATDTKLAISIALLFGGVYLIIFLVVRNYLKKNGEIRLKNNQIRFTSVNEAFSVVKEIKVAGIEKNFLDNFSKSARMYAKTQTFSQIASQLPRFIIEALAFGSVLIIIIYLMIQNGTFLSGLPKLALFALAGYRLMPALQQIYASISQLTFVEPSLNKLIYELKYIQPSIKRDSLFKLSHNDSIKLININFTYPDSSRSALNNINLNISAKTTVGFVGSTGSGKTTLVDVILGLLEPQKGSLLVDGKIISKKTLRSWQDIIGYVPQNIFLLDDSISANIAFGLRQDEINQEKVEKVCKIANLHNFIINELNHKYQTKIGERGVRLSGGQRQRIAIARALYNDPKVLIFDEATSALDNETEEAVMDALNTLNKDITIILVAHRLNTLKNCHKIFKLVNGQISGELTYKDLIS